MFCTRMSMNTTSDSRRVERRMRNETILSILLMLSHTAFTQGRQNNPPQPTDIPEVASRLFKATGLDRQYEFSPHLKPTYLTGDFDGDGKPDIAILVIRRSSKKIGIAVCHSSTNKVFFIGAGTEVGNGGDNFDWMDIWRVTPKVTAARKVGRAAERGLTASLTTDRHFQQAAFKH